MLTLGGIVRLGERSSQGYRTCSHFRDGKEGDPWGIKHLQYMYAVRILVFIGPTDDTYDREKQAKSVPIYSRNFYMIELAYSLTNDRCWVYHVPSETYISTLTLRLQLSVNYGDPGHMNNQFRSEFGCVRLPPPFLTTPWRVTTTATKADTRNN